MRTPHPVRPPRRALALGALVAVLCLLLCGTALGASVKVPLPSTPMRGADAREVRAAASATWAKIRRAKAAPGLWVGIWDPRRGYWEGAFGRARRGGPAASVDDHLRIGSITKTFTAAVVLDLVAEGELALGGKVGAYDPELVREFPPLGKVTVAQLLSMRSGIPDYLNVPGGVIRGIFESPGRIWTPEELVAEAFEEAVAKPGTAGYSTTNFIVLQLIAEAVSGRSIESLIAERVTRPLGLRDTALQAPATVRLPRPGSGGYVGGPGAKEFREYGASTATPGTDVSGWSLSWAQGGGGMYSTLHDLGVWAASGVGNVLLPKALAKRRFQTRPVPDVAEYGLGVQRIGNLFGHTGETIGAETFAFNDPDTGVTFVISANATSANTGRFLELLFRLYPGEEP